MYPLLQVKDLSISFGSFAAVDGINFELQPGKITAIVGESGSGKSLTALSILQLLPPSASVTGKLIYREDNNKEILLTKLSKKEITFLRGNGFSMIFQEPMTSLNPVLRCGSQVTEAILQHQDISKKAAREKTLALFQEVELPNPTELYNRFPHEISGGQKQRVIIAMAICNNPKLLIADEPTTALDVRVQKSILNLIKKIQQQFGMSVLFITHDLGLVAEVADEVLVMKNGKIVETGKVASVLKNPKHEYTKALLNCRPSAGKKGIKLPVIGEEETQQEQEIASSNIQTHHIPSPLLEVKNLSVIFHGSKKFLREAPPSFTAVKDVSFQINENEILGLVGESGCGKTTLGRALLRLIEPAAGSIKFNGAELLSIDKKQLRHIRKELQIVFQDPFGSLNPRISIGDAIEEPLRIHHPELNKKQAKEKVAALLQSVKVSPDHTHRYPHEFSGGQRQRICIARALASNPSFLVFDESVSALDVSVQAQVLNLINELKSTIKFAALFISHDLSVVEYISDRIMVMRNGKIVETGTAEEVFYHPANPYTKELIAAIPGL